MGINIQDSTPLVESRKDLDRSFSESVELGQLNFPREFDSQKNQENPSIALIPNSLRTEVRKYSWHTINIQGRVIKTANEDVICECLLDKQNGIFETRSFPKRLFLHLGKLSERPYVYISIRSKVGAIRIDINDGSKLVDKKLFELKESWEDPSFQDFGNSPDKPIEL